MIHLVSEPVRSILLRLDKVYANGDMALAHNLDRGERGDTLADFIHFEVCEVAGHLAPGEEREAADLAIASLDTARRELIDVATALEGLKASESLEQVLQAADAAYNCGEGRIAEDLEDGERGDTLADFIRMEIKDVTSGSVRPALDAFLAINTGVAELNSCIRELESMGWSPKPKAM